MAIKTSPVAAKKTSTPALKSKVTFSSELKEQMIREAAYFLAEKDGFQPGKELENWVKAEQQIEKQVSISFSAN